MSRFFLLFVLFFGLSLHGQSQQTDSLVSQQQIVATLRTMEASFSGNAENCIPYDVYAFKYKRTWLLALVEAENLDLFIIKPPRKAVSPYPASHFMAVGLHMIALNPPYFRQRNRRKKINDIITYPFYKIKWTGKKAMKGLLYLEIPDLKERPSFFLWKLFAKRKKDAQAQAAGLKEGFDESIKGAGAQAEAAAEAALQVGP